MCSSPSLAFTRGWSRPFRMRLQRRRFCARSAKSSHPSASLSSRRLASRLLVRSASSTDANAFAAYLSVFDTGDPESRVTPPYQPASLPGVATGRIPRQNYGKCIQVSRRSPVTLASRRFSEGIRISRYAAKSRCAREWGGWSRLSVDGSGHDNPNRSEGP